MYRIAGIVLMWWPLVFRLWNRLRRLDSALDTTLVAMLVAALLT